VAEVFHCEPRADRTVILTGGVRTPSDALVGPVAVTALRSFRLDLVFMGVHGMHARAGFTTPNLLEAHTNQAFRDATDHLVVVADHSKWGITGLSTIAPLGDAATCITDTGLSAEGRAVMTAEVGRLVLCAPHGPGALGEMAAPALDHPPGGGPLRAVRP
jgi:DeoR/GlpR family transcriptional regulator of sugar metabolism